MLARMAGERSPENAPVIVSLLPTKIAFNEPEPATVGSIVASTGTVERRALKDSPFWAMPEQAAKKTRQPTKALTHPWCFAIGKGQRNCFRLTPARHLTPTVSRLANAGQGRGLVRTSS